MERNPVSISTLRLLAIITVLALAGVITVNGLANALPLNGVGTGQLSDELPNFFVPAGITFAVWGLIYLLLAGYVGAVVMDAFSGRAGSAWTATDAALFLANAAANIGWIFAWHWRLVRLALLLMIVILATLILLEERNFRRLKAGASLGIAKPFRRFLLSAPINVYLGWIMVASIANATALLVSLGWNGWGLDPRIWAVIVIDVATILAVSLVLYRRAIAAPLVVVWAFAGIVIKRLAIDGAATRAVWLSALIGSGLILIVLVISRLPQKRSSSLRDS